MILYVIWLNFAARLNAYIINRMNTYLSAIPGFALMNMDIAI